VLEGKICCANHRQDNKMECQSNGTVNGEAKATVIRTLVYEKTCLNVMLLVLAIGSQLPSYIGSP
jgi:hypothetical protein